MATKRLCMGIGPSDANIMIVGEAPGEEEADQGIPFVGRSGQLLNNCLNRAGLLRSQIYLINVVKERPPRNDISKFITFSSKGVKEQSLSYTQYVNELKEEIQKISPNVIVAVGGVALWALCEKRGISNYRGSILESTLVPGIKVIPTLHPASALRQYIWRHFITLDLTRVAEHQFSGEIPLFDADYIIEPSFDQCMSFLKWMMVFKRVAFDIEVSNKELSCISLSPYVEDAEAREGISIPFIDRNGREYFPPDQEVEIISAISRLLSNPEQEHLTHNGTFDATFLYRKYGIHTRNIHDTMIAEAILYPDFPKSLAFVTSVWCDGFPYYKDEGKERMKYGTGEQFWLYNIKDSIVLNIAFPKMLDALKMQGNLEAYERQRQLIEPFLYMSERGIRIDTDGMDSIRQSAIIEIERLTAELQKAVGTQIGQDAYDFNPRSSKQVREYFYDICGLPPYRNIKTGEPTTDETALKRLARNPKEHVSIVARTLLEIRRLEKMKGTYYEMTLDEDQRLRCSMNPVGTRMGRPSSSKTIFGTGANLQNQPPESKRFMLPDEGYVLYKWDLQQAENRVVALVAGDDAMLLAFESGIDIHSLTASLIFGGEPTEEYQDNKKADLGGGRFTQRYWGKKANHASNYGMGSSLAGLLWEIPNREAAVILNRYHDAYKSVRRWHDSVQRLLRKNRTVENLLGRRYKFWDRWSDQLFKEAYAFIPQSTIAEITNQTFIRIYNEMKVVEILLIEHDGFYYQVPLDLGWEAHSEILLTTKKVFEPILTYEGRRTHIPAECVMLPNFDSKSDLAKKLRLEKFSPSHLEEKHEQLLRATSENWPITSST